MQNLIMSAQTIASENAVLLMAVGLSLCRVEGGQVRNTEVTDSIYVCVHVHIHAHKDKREQSGKTPEACEENHSIPGILFRTGLTSEFALWSEPQQRAFLFEACSSRCHCRGQGRLWSFAFHGGLKARGRVLSPSSGDTSPNCGALDTGVTGFHRMAKKAAWAAPVWFCSSRIRRLNAAADARCTALLVRQSVSDEQESYVWSHAALEAQQRSCTRFDGMLAQHYSSGARQGA